MQKKINLNFHIDIGAVSSLLQMPSPRLSLGLVVKMHKPCIGLSILTTPSFPQEACGALYASQRLRQSYTCVYRKMQNI